MNFGTELQHRAKIASYRKASSDAALRAQGKRDEESLLDDTRALDEHPLCDDGEMYDGPCECRECLGYST